MSKKAEKKDWQWEYCLVHDSAELSASRKDSLLVDLMVVTPVVGMVLKLVDWMVRI